MKEFIKKLLKEEYELTVWFANGAEPRVKRVFRLKKVTKLTNQIIEGVDVTGGKIIVKVNEPFDYQLKKVY